MAKRWYWIGLLAACVVVTAGEWGVFSHYNALLSGNQPAASVKSPVSQPRHDVQGIEVLDDNPRLISVSDSGQSIAYVDPANTLRVVDLTNGKETMQVPLGDDASIVQWIGDSSLFLGTEVAGGYGKTLELSTVSTDTGEIRKIHDFDGMSQAAQFSQVTYSQFTNDIYVLVASQTNSLMYHFNTNGDLQQISLGGRYVTSADVTQKTNVLFFQAKFGSTTSVYKHELGTNTRVRTDSVLLRVLNDTLFFGVVDGDGNVTRIDQYENGELSQYLTLSNPTPPDKVFVNSDGDVLLVGGNSYINEQTHKTVALPQYTNLVIRGDAMIFLTANGAATVVS